MNVLYIAPRYHTNQIPVVKGWIADGDSVKFISQYKGKTEDYSVLTPDVLGYSILFKGINWIYVNMINRKQKDSANTFAFEMKCGIPPIFILNRKMKEFRPDIVILRERSIYNIAAYFLCRLNKFPAVLYNQSPLWNQEKVKNDIWHKIVRRYTPSKRMTPVLGTMTPESQKEENSYYIPFVAETKIAPEEKRYFRNDKIHLLCVAKYEKRKNILMLLDSIRTVKEKFPVVLTIVGEVSTNHHRDYYQKAEEYIRENCLKENVVLKKNISMAKMQEEYAHADLFILPSTKEVASVSQLEAMSCSLAVICSNTNGSACYIEEGKNGFLFHDNNNKSLEEKIVTAISDPEQLVKMGSYSYQLAKESYSFLKYKQKVRELL